MATHVVIIGGSYAAILAFRSILSVRTPAVEVTMISPSDHAWNNMCSPRLLIEVDRKGESIVPLKKIFTKYARNTPHAVRHIKDHVTQVDLQNNRVTLSSGETVEYTILVIATGTRGQTYAFKLSPSADYTESFNQIDDLAEKIKKAKSIAIVGGGATGVEIAGELGYNYGKDKKIVLYTGTKAPIKDIKPSLQLAAQKKLNQVGIDVINNLKVTEIKEGSIRLTDNTTENFDLIIPTFKETPNTEFLDNSVLNDLGYVITDEFFRLKAFPNVMAIGDVAESTPKLTVDIYYYQAKVFRSTLAYLIRGEGSLKKYIPTPHPMLIVPISKNGGVGVAWGFDYPNFLIKFFRCRDYGIKRSESFLL